MYENAAGHEVPMEAWGQDLQPKTGTSLALIGELEKAGALTSIGLRISHEIDYNRFEALLAMMGTVHQSMQWAIGDALIYGEMVFGDAVFQASEVLKISPDTRNRYRRTAERVPYSRRRPELSWSHHFVVSTLPAADQVEWLDKAVVNDYSKHDLEELIRPSKDPKDTTVVCPACGEVFLP